MKTFANETQSNIPLTYEANGVTKSHIVSPGQRFTFDETESNGPQIEQQLADGGAHPIQE